MINPFKAFIEGFKENFTSLNYVEPPVVGDELTTKGKDLKDYVHNFYERKLQSSITKSDIKNYTDKIERVKTLPNSAWNKLALGNRIDALWFISFWNGDVDDLVI